MNTNEEFIVSEVLYYTATPENQTDEFEMVMSTDFERVCDERDASQSELAALREENERLKSESFEELYNAAIDERDALREEIDSVGLMAMMLEDREWSDHAGKGPIAERMEYAITEMHNELAAEKARSDREMDSADEESAALREAIRDLKDWCEHSQSLSAFASIIARAEAVIPVPGPLRKSLKAAEQRNSELVELLRELDDNWNSHDGRERFSLAMRKVEAALKPTESGASE